MTKHKHLLGHVRDEKGKLLYLHPIEVANVVHTLEGVVLTTCMRVVEYDEC